MATSFILRYFKENNIKNIAANFMLPSMLGTAACILVLGWQPIPPENITWLQKDYDSAQHYIGWLFYRDSPWSFPIGANPNFGMEIGSSIVYSDSIPLFAAFFKLFSGLLPETFQYFGLWLLLCFILQAYFAWQLSGLVTNDTLTKMSSTGLFLFSPPFLYRACFTGAEALAGHWLILAGLYLCLLKRTELKKWKWLALVVIAGLVHAYILAMVLLLWLSDTLKRFITKEVRLKPLLYEYFLVITGTLLSLWQAGYFIIKSGLGSFGFGSHRMNVLALINPFTSYPPESQVMPEKWSYILPSLPQSNLYEYEGFNYLGIGIIILFVISLPPMINYLRRAKFEWTWLPLFISCIILTLFAITNHIGIGSMDLAVWIPDKLTALASIFRASGRMFWPVYYLLTLFLLFLLIRSYKKKAVMAILLGVLVMQVVDTSAGWWPKKQENSIGGKTWSEPFISPFWAAAAAHYKKIIVLPSLAANVIEKNKVAYFAARHNMLTDAAYLGRYDAEKLAKLDIYESYLLSTGNYEPDTLYFIGFGLSDKNMARMYLDDAIQHLNSDRDICALIDGYVVIAPAWKYGLDSSVQQLRE